MWQQRGVGQPGLGLGEGGQLRLDRRGRGRVGQAPLQLRQLLLDRLRPGPGVHPHHAGLGGEGIGESRLVVARDHREPDPVQHLVQRGRSRVLRGRDLVLDHRAGRVDDDDLAGVA